jgi:hypothetical protein
MMHDALQEREKDACISFLCVLLAPVLLLEPKTARPSPPVWPCRPADRFERMVSSQGAENVYIGKGAPYHFHVSMHSAPEYVKLLRKLFFYSRILYVSRIVSCMHRAPSLPRRQSLH